MQSTLLIDIGSVRNNVFRLGIYYPSLNLTENCLIVVHRDGHDYGWSRSYGEIVAMAVAFILLFVIVAAVLFVSLVICGLCFCRVKVVETYMC